MGDFTKTTSAVLLLLAILTISSCHPATRTTTRTTDSVRFFAVALIPVIEGKINGKRAYFIVDTGASCSILNESVAKHFGFASEMSLNEQLMGLSGAARIKTAYSYSIEIGPLRIRNIIFRTRKIDELVDAIENTEKITIAGIIGADVLKKYQMGIDFGNNKITFQHKVKNKVDDATEVSVNDRSNSSLNKNWNP